MIWTSVWAAYTSDSNPSWLLPGVQVVWKSGAVGTQNNFFLYMHAWPRTWRPNVILFFFVCGAAETTAAVGISLSSDGQSIAYQSDYEPQWKTKRLLRGLGDNTKDYLTCSSSWPGHIVGVLNPPVATNVLISVWFITSHWKKGALWSVHCKVDEYLLCFLSALMFCKDCAELWAVFNSRFFLLSLPYYTSFTLPMISNNNMCL